jgi:hypothetical protein
MKNRIGTVTGTPAAVPISFYDFRENKKEPF